MSGRKKIIWITIIAFFAMMFVVVGTALISQVAENYELENNRLIQNHGTTNVVFPIYYIDPRTDTCYAIFPRGHITSVECSDDVKNLISNYWINNKE
ncbi:hypothetical protein LCGC14_1528970 [marine sediment metagenome]|uniref:Uncharacterized protein n=1 Tax=marine sediment metagenome TaxID=412755 RepID=A0A0F9IWC7_9ZZZZ